MTPSILIPSVVIMPLHVCVHVRLPMLKVSKASRVTSQKVEQTNKSFSFRGVSKLKHPNVESSIAFESEDTLL